MIVAVRRVDGHEIFRTVGALPHRFILHPHIVGVGGVGVDVCVVERPQQQRVHCAHLRPRIARIIGAIHAGLWLLGFHQYINAIWRRCRDRNVGLADDAGGQAASQLRPRAATVSGAIDAAVVLAAGDDGPRPTYTAPRCRVQRVRIVGPGTEIGDAGGVVHEQHLLPRFTTVCGAIHTTFFRVAERHALRGDECDIGVGRVDHHCADLSDIAQAAKLPCLARVVGAIHAASDDHIRSNAIGAGADPDDVRIGRRDADRADGSGGEVSVRDVDPALASVSRLPHAAAGCAHIELVFPLRHTGYRRDASAAEGSDVTEFQRLCGARIDAAGGLRRHRRGKRSAEHCESKDGAERGHGGGR